MRDVFHKKGMVIAIICLFIGASFVPSISSESRQTKTIYGETQETSSVNIRTIIVDDEGDGNTTIIQGAIDIAGEGDIIKVYSGTYVENVIVNKQLTIIGIDEELGIGDDIGKPIIDCERKGDVVHISADGVNISGFTIRNSGRKGNWSDGDAGIEIHSNYNTISNNNILNNGYGIFPNSCSNNTISDNNIDSNKWDGIYSYNSFNNTVSNNTFLENGIAVYDSFNNNFVDNTINGKPLIYLEGESDISIDYAGQVVLVNCNNISVQNQELYNTTLSIELWNSDNCLISNNDISFSKWNGILLCDSNKNTISGNTISSNEGYGIFLYSDDNNLYSSDSNIISDNNISYNLEGIVILEPNKNNIIFHNNFINNMVNAEDSGSVGNNYWDNGSVGNFWSDQWYRIDRDYDGISDVPYYVRYIGVDWYPMMLPYPTPSEIIPPEIEIIAPKENYLNIDNKEPTAETSMTIIFALPSMKPLTMKVYATSDYGVGTVSVFIDTDYTYHWKNHIDMQPTKPGSSLYTAKLDKPLFLIGMHNFTFVAYDAIWGIEKVKYMNVFLFYFPRPTFVP